MATCNPQTADLSLCLMCLEAPGEHKIGSCDHRFCQRCLTSHIERQLKEKAAVTCPACKTQATTVPDATPKMASQTQGVSKIGHLGQIQNEQCMPRAKKDAVEGTIKCKLCHLKGNQVKAVNMCKACKDLPLCFQCSKEHSERRRTKGHVVVRLSTKEEVLCSAHDEPLELFCKPCSKVVCHLCTYVNHDDHEIETFNDIVFVEVDSVRKAVKSEEERLTMLQADNNELEQSKGTAEQMQEVVLKAIEDHADKCVDAILKTKEELKEKVRHDFQVIGVLTKRLEAMPELLKASEKIIAEATRLLDREAELHSSYVEKLVNTKQELAKLEEARPAYDEEKKAYHISFDNLRAKNPMFQPRTPNLDIGYFKKPRPRCDEGGGWYVKRHVRDA